MARRRKSSGLFSNKYIMYGLYAAVAYYGYSWWMGRQTVPMVAQPTTTTLGPSVSAYPSAWLP